MSAIMMVLACTALADGGAVRGREIAGPFLVTIFTDPASPTTGRMDVTVMVQQGNAGAVVLDAEVDIFLFSPPGIEIAGGEILCAPDGTGSRPMGTGYPAMPSAIPAKRSRATNKLLYAATVNLPAAGLWQMRVRVRHGLATAAAYCALPVTTAKASLSSLVPFLAMPPVVIALFALHQRLRRLAVTRRPREGQNHEPQVLASAGIS